MTFKEYLLYNYLNIKQKINTFLSNLLVKFVGFKDLKIVEHNSKSYTSSFLLSFKFYLYTMLTKYCSCFKFDNLIKKLEVDCEKIHITKLDYNGQQPIIIDALYKFDSKSVTFRHTNNVLKTVGVYGTMMRNVFLNFDLCNDSKPQCLKNILMKYNDPTRLYHNTLQNILLFNDIEYNTSSELFIKQFKDHRIQSSKVPLNSHLPQHINQVIETV